MQLLHLDYFMNLVREQDLFETKILMGDSKAKVGLSFMYDCPAGLKDVSFHMKKYLVILTQFHSCF